MADADKSAAADGRAARELLMLKYLTLGSLVLSGLLGALSWFVNPAWFGVTDESARIMLIGGTGVLAMIFLLAAVLGAAAMLMRAAGVGLGSSSTGL